MLPSKKVTQSTSPQACKVSAGLTLFYRYELRAPVWKQAGVFAVWRGSHSDMAPSEDVRIKWRLPVLRLKKIDVNYLGLFPGLKRRVS